MTNVPAPAHDQEHIEAVRDGETGRFLQCAVSMVRRDVQQPSGRTDVEIIRAHLRLNAAYMSRELINALSEAAFALQEREEKPWKVNCYGEKLGDFTHIRTVWR